MKNRRLAMILGGMMLLGGAVTFKAGELHAQNEMQMHPRIAAAIAGLRDARAYLAAAPHDFGGHRVAAIAAIDTAILQLHEALQYRSAIDHH